MSSDLARRIPLLIAWSLKAKKDPMHNTTKNALLLGLHFLPGLIFTAVLFSVMPVIAKMGADLFLVQIALVTVFLLGTEILIAHLYCKRYEGRGIWSALKSANTIGFNWKAIGAAVLWAAMSVVVMKAYLWAAAPLIASFRELPFLSLPAWHFQNLDFPPYPAAVKTLLLVGMLGTNVFAEEVYFRGFLLERLQFLGRYAFVVNGVLFILYHVFQMRVSYPLVPFGLLISGYYVMFRNVWGAMLIHLILNLSL